MTVIGSTEISLHAYETRVRFALFPQLAREPDDALVEQGEPTMETSITTPAGAPTSSQRAIAGQS